MIGVVALFRLRSIIAQLVIRDLKERYIGSVLGFLWPLIQQVAFVAVVGVVLQAGLRVAPMSKVPFILWLFPAQSLWMFFQEAVGTSVGTFIGYSYLVKKIQFPLSILPGVKVITALVNHGLMLVIVAVLLLWSNIPLTWFWLQSLYYLAACALLCLALGWLLSSLAVFVRDTVQVVGLALTFGMWVTPVFWDLHNLRPVMKFVVELNPLTYLVEGYRKSFLYGQPFWTDPWGTAYYWAVTGFLFVAGLLVYRRLKPHFADVL